MHNIQKMLASSNPKSIGNLKIQSYFPNASDLNNATDSCFTLVPNNTIPNLHCKEKMKMEIPLPRPQNKSRSLILAPFADPRINLPLDKAIEYELKHGRRKLDPNMEEKKLRRTISNRLSAQRSTMKKSQHINYMEKMVKDLEGMISVLTSQVERYKEQRKQLLLQNDSLRKLIEIRSRESDMYEALLERKRTEICRLKGLAITMQIPKCALVQSEPKMAPTFGFEQQQSSFSIELPVDEALVRENSQEEEDIDQYLNFEAINFDPASV